MQTSIQARQLHKSFSSSGPTTHVIKDLSLDISPGKLTFIVGPSGCGKSTLLALISGLQRPDSGEVKVFGESIWKKTNKQLDAFRLAHCGFVFQGFHLFSALTALEQVMLPIEYAGNRQAKDAAMEALSSVGLAEKSHLRPIELSGGEKQRVAIARAIVKQPSLIFADEPTSALDAENGQIVTDLLHHVARERNTTILCVTHDARLLKHADRVIELEDGCIISDTDKTLVAETEELMTCAKLVQQGPSTQIVRLVRQQEATPLGEFCAGN